MELIYILWVLLYFLIGCIITKIFAKYIIKDDFDTIKQNISVGMLFSVTVLPLFIITITTILVLLYKLIKNKTL